MAVAERSHRPSAPKISLAAPIKGDIRAGLIGTWLIALVNAVFLVLIGRAMDDALTGQAILGVTTAWLVVMALVRAALGWAIPARGTKAAGRLELNMRERVFRSVMAQGAPV